MSFDSISDPSAVINKNGVCCNARNGKSRKTLKGEFGELPIEILRDRHGTFALELIPKHQTRWKGFDDKILSLYARGMRGLKKVAGEWTRVCLAWNLKRMAVLRLQ